MRITLELNECGQAEIKYKGYVIKHPVFKDSKSNESAFVGSFEVTAPDGEKTNYSTLEAIHGVLRGVE